MDIRWYINRFKLMSVEERLFRCKELFSKYVLNKLFLPLFKRNIDLKFKREVLKRINWDINNIEKLTSINNKKMTLFTVEIDPLKIDNWRKDYKNDIVSPQRYYAFLKKQDFKNIGDIRYISQLNRLHHFPIIAGNIVSRNNKELLVILHKQITNWIEQNPFLYTINWTSGIEISIRAINLLYTYLILEYFSKSVKDNLFLDIKNKILKILGLSFIFLKNHLSLYSSANNHLTAELMGLIAINSVFKFKNSEKYLHKFLKMQLNELKRQIHEDGFTKEQAIRYHAEVFDHFLISFRFAELGNFNVPEWAYQKLFRMAEVLSYFINSNGFVQQIGDGDDGYVIYPYNDNKFNLYISILNSASFLHKNCLFFEHIKLDFRNYLLFGEDFVSFVKNSNLKENFNILKKKTKLFEKSGYLFIIDPPIKLIFDVGHLGLDPLAAHGHADVLNFLLEVDNFPIIIDPGTFQYHVRYKKWRDYFRGTKAHNTISINKKDQATSGGRMMWLIKPDVKLISFFENNNFVECVAEHNGFYKQGIPIIHRRSLFYNKSTKIIQIKDQLIPISKIDNIIVSFFLHFHPSLEVSHNKDIILIKSPSKNIIIQNPLFNKGSLVFGDNILPLGWYSPSFDCKIPTYSFFVEDSVKPMNNMTTTISIIK